MSNGELLSAPGRKFALSPRVVLARLDCQHVIELFDRYAGDLELIRAAPPEMPTMILSFTASGATPGYGVVGWIDGGTGPNPGGTVTRLYQRKSLNGGRKVTPIRGTVAHTTGGGSGVHPMAA